MLRATGLSKRYGDVQALDDVDLTVERGQIVGFLGPNGAGKTTAMRAIMRLVDLDAGQVTWDDQMVDETVRRRFGYMPAERGMYPQMRVREHLVYYGRLSGQSPSRAIRAADTWLERFGLTDRADTDVQDLSSGNQQRVQLALALLDEPELLVLDEPFAGLDPVAVNMLSEVLREQVDAGAALLLSSHQLDLVANVCGAVAIVDDGRIVLRGTVDELRAGAEHRYAAIEYVEPTSWQASFSSVHVVSQDGRHIRLRTDRTTDPRKLLDEASAHGPVQSFSFAPPDLSEVFLATVGADQQGDSNGTDQS